MKGYIALNKDLTYREFKYEIGQEYKIKQCQTQEFGFDFCICPKWCDRYWYFIKQDITFVEIEVLGDIMPACSTYISRTYHIKIVKELTREELLNAATGWFEIERHNFILDRFNFYFGYKTFKEKYLYDRGILTQLICGDGTSIKYKNEIVHSDNDEPAIIYPNGTRQWFCNGFEHRLYGPSTVFPGGSERWCCNGVPHRTDGPAIFNSLVNEKIWYINGVKIAHQYLLGEKTTIDFSVKKTRFKLKNE